jgi:hypothetical protein
VAHSKTGDVFAMATERPSNFLSSTTIEAIALTGLPSYLARLELKSKLNLCRKRIIANRVRVLQEVLAADDWANAKRVLENSGIRWFFTLREQSPKWHEGGRFAVFSSDGFFVYDSGAVSTDHFKEIQC